LAQVGVEPAADLAHGDARRLVPTPHAPQLTSPLSSHWPGSARHRLRLVADTVRRRIDLCQGGLVELPEIQCRAGEVFIPTKKPQHKRTSVKDEVTARSRQPAL
jgi:hypothetical protein